MLYHCRMDRVLEVGGYAAGFCGRLFAQCGAEVGGPALASVRDVAIGLYRGRSRCALAAERGAAAAAVACGRRTVAGARGFPAGGGQRGTVRRLAPLSHTFRLLFCGKTHGFCRHAVAVIGARRLKCALEWRTTRCAARASSTSRTFGPACSPPASSPISAPAVRIEAPMGRGTVAAGAVTQGAEEEIQLAFQGLGPTSVRNSIFVVARKVYARFERQLDAKLGTVGVLGGQTAANQEDCQEPANLGSGSPPNQNYRKEISMKLSNPRSALSC